MTCSIAHYIIAQPQLEACLYRWRFANVSAPKLGQLTETEQLPALPTPLTQLRRCCIRQVELLQFLDLDCSSAEHPTMKLWGGTQVHMIRLRKNLQQFLWCYFLLFPVPGE